MLASEQAVLAPWTAQGTARPSHVLLNEESSSKKCDDLCECCRVCVSKLGHICMGNMFLYVLHPTRSPIIGPEVLYDV